MIDRSPLRVSATLMLAGQLLFIVITLFHADGQANDHPSVFTEYAASGSWKAVHLLQFVAIAILLAGLLALFFALDSCVVGMARWAGRFGATAAVVTLALYGVLQAVDGIGNQQVDKAWIVAAGAEKSARFASAEAMRWLEWGVRSYQDYTLGLALLLFAAAFVRTVRLSPAIAVLMALSGLTYLVQGWVIGAEGFSATHSTLILVAYAFSLAWMVWLVVVAWRTERPEAASARG
jgi:hypothetical protein